ncbi:hypothetical protein JCM3766R1_004433 [Sporobolomyces carnicolor]
METESGAVGKRDEEEASVGLMQKPSSDTPPAQDPFVDSHAVPTKPMWHRAIVAGVILAALVGLALGVGLGVSKIKNKVAQIEANRSLSSLDSLSTSTLSATSPSSSSPITTTDSTRSSSSSSSQTQSTITLSSSASHTAGSLTGSSGGRDDIFWAVPKTV